MKTKKQKFMGLVAAVCLSLFSLTISAAPTNKQLVIGMSQEFEILNPMISQMLASTILGGFCTRTFDILDAQWKWVPGVMVSIPTLENGGAKFIEEGGKKKILANWEIKENAKWGDGQPITAEDVKLAWEIAQSPNVSVGEKETYSQVESITVDPSNPKKFTFKYDQARYDFAYLPTFYIMPSHLEKSIWEKTKNAVGDYEKQTVFNTDPTNPGLYNGPYVVKELKLGSHVVFERNPYFYGTPAKIERIIVKYIPDTSTLEANLLSGSVDMLNEISLKMDEALDVEKRIKNDPAQSQKYQVLYRSGLIYEHIDLNLRDPMLKDVNVRKAMMYAIDREKLVQALFQGKQQVADSDIHPLDVYHTDEITKYTYDPKKAAELLDAAGWKLGADGIRVKDGKRMEMTIMTTAGDKTRELVEVYLQNQWKAAGINVLVKNEPARVYFGETVRKAQFPQMAMYAHSSAPDSPPKSVLSSENIPTAANGYSGQNTMGWKNAAADAALNQISFEFDVEKRKELMNQVLKAMTDEVPIISLYFRSEIAIVPSNIKGFEVTGHQFPSSNFSENWTFE